TVPTCSPTSHHPGASVLAAGRGRGPDDARREALMDEAHHHRTLADRGGAALDRSRTNIAHCEDTRHARLEDALRAGPRARDDEAVAVENDGATEPVGVRCGSEEEKEERERDPLAVLERRSLELAVGAV